MPIGRAGVQLVTIVVCNIPIWSLTRRSEAKYNLGPLMVIAANSYSREPLLSVAEGTARHLASAFPKAEVVGLDLSAVPAEEGMNAIFVRGDIMDDGVVNGPFDLIYSRMLVYGIPSWPAYVARAWDMLSPDGWLEFQEADTSVAFDGIREQMMEYVG